FVEVFGARVIDAHGPDGAAPVAMVEILNDLLASWPLLRWRDSVFQIHENVVHAQGGRLGEHFFTGTGYRKLASAESFCFHLSLSSLRNEARISSLFSSTSGARSV